VIFKSLDGLDCAVLCEAEVFQLEIGDDLSVAVSHENVQNDEADIGAQFCRGRRCNFALRKGNGGGEEQLRDTGQKRCLVWRFPGHVHPPRMIRHAASIRFLSNARAVREQT
jgi:hypothetical protein